MKCYDNELYLYSQNTIRECRGLSLLISLLSHDNNAVNIKAAQVLSNLSMNEENQQTLKVSSSNKFIALVPRAVVLFGQYQKFQVGNAQKLYKKGHVEQGFSALHRRMT